MSNDAHSSPLPPEPSDRRALFSAIGWIGAMFIFVLILTITYVTQRRDVPSEFFDEERIAIRERVESAQIDRMQHYAWENQQAGVVRIPVERAMELVVRDLRAQQNAAASAQVPSN